MKISKVIEKLKRIEKEEGDIEVVITHDFGTDGNIETTLENFEVKTNNKTFGKKYLRLWF